MALQFAIVDFYISLKKRVLWGFEGLHFVCVVSIGAGLEVCLKWKGMFMYL